MQVSRRAGLKITLMKACTISFLIFFPFKSHGEAVITDSGIFPASFRLSDSARAAATGFSGAGFVNDASSLASNPAGLAHIENFEISLNHTAGFEQSYREAVTAGVRAGKIGGIALSVNFSDSGLFERRDMSGALLEGLNGANEAGIRLGWGGEMPAGITAGMSAAYSKKAAAGTDIHAYAATAGIISELGDSLRFSAAVTGAGYSGMPSGISVIAGFVYEAGLEDAGRLTAAIAGGFDGVSLSTVSAGIEASVISSIFIRAGYTHDTVEQMSGGLQGFSAGAGIRFDSIQIDYAFVPQGDLGNSHRISMTYSPAVKQAPAADGGKRVYLPKSDRRVIAFESVRFGHNKYRLTYGMKELLKKNIELLLKNPDTEVRIAGHTSMCGPKDYNKKLSELRAMAVRNYLIREGGIAPDRIFIIGYGDSKPAVIEEDPFDVDSDAAKMNRRGMFEIVKTR